jgi:hypothetical protein
LYEYGFTGILTLFLFFVKFESLSMKVSNNHLNISIILTLMLVFISCSQPTQRGKFKTALSIPSRGNSWVTDSITDEEKMISDSGITGWTDKNSVIRTWFRVEQTGMITIAVRARVKSGKSEIQCTFGNETKNLSISNTAFDTIEIGTFNIVRTGYQPVTLKGVSKKGASFADVSGFLVTGPATNGKVYFIKEDFYWGRRGPSVHIRYDVPDEARKVVWFYNEITVPEGNDVYGSYFMADGFADGYFGIQVNGPDERRILFSVWSPFKTDNPKDIPEEMKIKLLKKGEGVHAGEFGSEGSGGQSYMRYMWKAGTTYKFLLKGEPSVNNSTDYTAYFYAPEAGHWQLIAGFRRPKTNNYLKNLHSFLENFWTGTGYITRRGLYSNQWVITSDGKWFELNSARFTADATARKESRLDYAGGIEKGAFFLKNCGFFDVRTEINAVFKREIIGHHPEINFKDLE